MWGFIPVRAYNKRYALIMSSYHHTLHPRIRDYCCIHWPLRFAKLRRTILIRKKVRPGYRTAVVRMRETWDMTREFDTIENDGGGRKKENPSLSHVRSFAASKQNDCCSKNKKPERQNEVTRKMETKSSLPGPATYLASVTTRVHTEHHTPHITHDT